GGEMDSACPCRPVPGRRTSGLQSEPDFITKVADRFFDLRFLELLRDLAPFLAGRRTEGCQDPATFGQCFEPGESLRALVVMFPELRLLVGERTLCPGDGFD